MFFPKENQEYPRFSLWTLGVLSLFLEHLDFGISLRMPLKQARSLFQNKRDWRMAEKISAFNQKNAQFDSLHPDFGLLQKTYRSESRVKT